MLRGYVLGGSYSRLIRSPGHFSTRSLHFTADESIPASLAGAPAAYRSLPKERRRDTILLQFVAVSPAQQMWPYFFSLSLFFFLPPCRADADGFGWRITASAGVKPTTEQSYRKKHRGVVVLVVCCFFFFTYKIPQSCFNIHRGKNKV